MTFSSPTEPLAWATAWRAWHFDMAATVCAVLLVAGYAWPLSRARRHRSDTSAGWVSCFVIGIGCWVLASMSFVGVYAHTLFWIRALQVVLLLLVAPFFLTLGRPMTITRNALPQWALDGLSRAVPSTLARTMTHPLTTSLAMLATPWLLYLTPWYTASLTNGALGAATRIMLVLIGFSYFYARLQVDPVPRRYPQLISLLISVAETIGDGVLGLWCFGKARWWRLPTTSRYTAPGDRICGPIRRSAPAFSGFSATSLGCRSWCCSCAHCPRTTGHTLHRLMPNSTGWANPRPQRPPRPPRIWPHPRYGGRTTRSCVTGSDGTEIVGLPTPSTGT